MIIVQLLHLLYPSKDQVRTFLNPLLVGFRCLIWKKLLPPNFSKKSPIDLEPSHVIARIKFYKITTNSGDNTIFTLVEPFEKSQIYPFKMTT